MGEASAAQRVEVRALPLVGDSGASTSAAGRNGSDEKPMSGQDKEKASERRSEDKTEEVDRINPCPVESHGRNKEFSENGAKPMEKLLQNHETLSGKNTNSKKRERDEN